ncbi:NAD(P)-dependent alcohol dehydrogenase [Rhodopirellula sp. JC639]|uniref:NAD(P)-dependent alcohol dehydrogenase n=1 Tax=Stieleria mannarensis TaxID=2755585 RepID=UPI00256FB091|nr:NAD(P)-dependent alcohol dehydrogenase [Rhodopirellula sp. JC639]
MTMKAMSQDRYGSPDLLRLVETPRPLAGEDDVLVRVDGAAVHVGDCFGVRGTPWMMRMATGLFKPTCGIPGYDFAGRIAAVGENVTQFDVGDEVFGAGQGTCAQYVTVPQSTVAPRPTNLSLAEAAAVPTSGLAALHALRDVANVQPGQRVLINGASGGIGTFAIQIAKSFGAEVTGVCSTRNVDLVRSLGADHVVDYTRDDFTAAAAQYDLIFDNVENRSLADCRRALKPTGMLILNSGTGARGIAMLVRLIKPLVMSPFVRHDLRRYLSVPNQDDLLVLKQLIESGAVRPIIDRKYELTQTPDAIRYLESGHARGKVVISVANADATPECGSTAVVA